MDSTLFLKANDQFISLQEGLRYLQLSGKLDSVIWEIIREHVLQQELQQIEDIESDSEILTKISQNFRSDNQLTDFKDFQNWLENEGINETIFRQQLANGLKLDLLKQQVTETNLAEYFIDRKMFLDRVILSRLVVGEKALAEELRSQVIEDGVSFEQLIREYSVAEDAIFNGMMGAISWGSLPDHLRMAIDGMSSGDLSEAVEIDGLWYVVRLESFLSASLSEEIKQELEDELFEQWLSEKIQDIYVEFLVDF